MGFPPQLQHNNNRHRVYLEVNIARNATEATTVGRQTTWLLIQILLWLIDMKKEEKEGMRNCRTLRIKIPITQSERDGLLQPRDMKDS